MHFNNNNNNNNEALPYRETKSMELRAIIVLLKQVSCPSRPSRLMTETLLNQDERNNRICCLWHNPGATGMEKGMGYDICLSYHLKGEGGVLMCTMYSDIQY